MIPLKLSQLPQFSGDSSGSYIVINDARNSTTYIVNKESFFTASLHGTASFALTASYAMNGGGGGGAGFPFSGSAVITGSLFVSESFVDLTSASYVLINSTGSLFGTSSWAHNSRTASYVEAANVVGLNLSRISSGSATASIQPGLFNVNTDTSIQGNLTASNFLTQGTITAQTLLVQYVTASTELITGSTKFGTQTTDSHQFTGSVSITGSFSVTGQATAYNLTGSLFGTSSWAEDAISASYARSASFSITNETHYRFENILVIDQDLWLSNEVITKVVKSVGANTVEYRTGSAAYTAIPFSGNTFTGSIPVTASDAFSWRITYNSGYTTATVVAVHSKVS